MMVPKQPEKPELPYMIHFTSAHNVMLSTHANGTRVFAYGDELEVTDEIVQLNTGRDGICSLLDRLRQGTVGIHAGPWPDGESRLLPGSFQFADARAAAFEAAWKIEDPTESRAARDRARRQFGSEPTSRTLQITRAGA